MIVGDVSAVCYYYCISLSKRAGAFLCFFFFFFNDTATTEIYTLSLHDALPIWGAAATRNGQYKKRGRSRKEIRAVIN